MSYIYKNLKRKEGIMHYHWQVLVKAKNKDDARIELDETMNGIDNENMRGVWDWYEVGGRWNEEENIINGTHPEFWERINQAISFQKKDLKNCVERLVEIFEDSEWTIETWIRKTDDFESIIREAAYQKINEGMATYYLQQIAKIKSGDYRSSSYFVTGDDICGSTELRKQLIEEIKKSPEDYWLVNIDIHN